MIKSEIDLHLHSTFSDGSLTPEELIRTAEKKTLKAIALTDHDTVKGINLFLKSAANSKIKAIAGVEFSVEDYEDINNLNRIHIANVVVSEGKLQLIVVEEHEDIERLKLAVNEIQAKETLPLTIEWMEDDGTLVMGDKPVTPKDSEYIYAVQDDLVRYGFLGRVKR